VNRVTNAARPVIELLYWSGCPSWPAALEDLRAAARSAGFDESQIAIRQVETDDEAESQRFPGSPTIRVDGRDIVDPGDEPVGLSCRVYRRRDGRISPTPDPADLREALTGALR
jgi:hypothetical protein